MRHRSKTAKLKRNASHRKALLSNLACSLIEHGRIKTTLGKAKALRPVAEKLSGSRLQGAPGRLLPHHQAWRPHERFRPDGLHRVGGPPG